MAASGGGTVPVPPKRPTIIRNTNNSSVPVRPAPPVPGNRPQPPVPSRPDDIVPSRPKPPPVSRPSEVVRPKSMPAAPLKPPDKSSIAPVKKRPEITIVCARPMSEVGFRDQNAPTSSDVPKPSETESIDQSDTSQVRPKSQPLPSPRPTSRFVPPGSTVSENGESFADTEKQTSVPSRGPPPPVPRPSVIKPIVSPTASLMGIPPVPGRPFLSPRSQKTTPSNNDTSSTPLSQGNDVISRPTPAVHKQPATAQHVSTTDHSVANSPPMPSGVPPPIPRNPSVVNRPPPPKVPPQVKTQEQIDPKTQSVPNDTQQDVNNSNSQENDQSIDNNDFYAVIDKPKRPTIIRPGRPSMKQASQTDSNLSKETKSETSNFIDNAPPVPKKRYDEEESDSNTNNKESAIPTRESNSNQEKPKEPSSNGAPEFLKMKLKSTTNDNLSDKQTDDSPSAGSWSINSANKGPPPGIKPRPSILPKPKVAAKPSVASKPLLDNSAGSKVSPKEDNSKLTANINKDNDGINGDKDQSNTSAEDIKPVTVAPKRPTIIRPSRSAQIGSSENVKKVEESNTIGAEKAQTVDDMTPKVELRPQPPLPNKRPVSMVNIPKAIEQEQSISSSKSLNFSTSSENISPDLRPSPRPAARSRPVTMATTPTARSPLPGTPPKMETSSPEKSSLPPRPLSRPPQKSPPCPSPKDPSMDPDLDTGPPKPIRRPPPPNMSQTVDTSSSENEEEFVVAQSKPDRPAGRPTPPRSSPGPTPQGGDDVEKRPPRPGGLPSPRKDPLPHTQHTDEKKSPVQVRPQKPDTRPTRPMSMPVKTKTEPPRPQAPRTSSVAQKGGAGPVLPRRPGPGHTLYHYMMQTPHGIALHDYTAQQQNDISFKLGDVVLLVKRIDCDWYMGQVNDKEGMFPCDFVKVKIPLPGEVVEGDSSSNDSAEMFFDATSDKPDPIGHGPRCQARFDYDGEGPDDLVFQEGEWIKLTDRVGLEWRRGQCEGRTGLFPLTYVEVIEDLPLEGDGDHSSRVVMAIFDFEGQGDELSFEKGETINILYQVNEEWLYGEIGTRQGQFPVQFIDHIPVELPPLPVQNTVAMTTDVAKQPPDHKLSQTQSMWDTEEPQTKHSTTHNANPTTKCQSEVPYCIGLYDYPGGADEDLIFNEGDKIVLLEEVGDDWLKGSFGGKTGMFPSAFVEVKIPLNDTESIPENKLPVLEGVQEVPCDAVGVSKFTPPTSLSMGVGVALHEFTGEADNELIFEEGEEIELQELVEGAEDWRWGVVHGRRGMFPTAFVEEVR